MLLKERWREEGKGRVDEEEDVSSYWMTLRKRSVLEFERERTWSHCMENWFWKGLQAWSKAASLWRCAVLLGLWYCPMSVIAWCVLLLDVWYCVMCGVVWCVVLRDMWYCLMCVIALCVLLLDVWYCLMCGIVWCMVLLDVCYCLMCVIAWCVVLLDVCYCLMCVIDWCVVLLWGIHTWSFLHYLN